MQMIHDALRPERLEEFRRHQREMADSLMKAPPDPEVAAERLNDTLRAKHDRDAEDADRRAFANRHQRRKANALDRPR